MAQTVPAHFVNWLQAVTHQNYRSTSLIQPLWNNYGSCFRAIDDHGESVVVKAVSPLAPASHPKGWNSHVGHNRKLTSYQVERHFYEAIQPCTTHKCYVPGLIASDSRNNATLLVLEDVDTAFPMRSAVLSVDQAECVLMWLAEFHGKFINLEDNQVWQEGTYWHLHTRLEEWEAMPASPLKDNAKVIAHRLANCTYRTLLHGDAKVANFCFREDYTQCAGVDFQYTGHGCGIKDVAYFIGSALSEEDQREHTENCLSIYFSHLFKVACKYHNSEVALDVVQEWQKLYNLACADFCRFLIGWSPEHWKLNSTLKERTQIALRSLL